MIFITVGTWHNGFDRLLQSVDKLAKEKLITDEIVAQVGNSKYKPSNFTRCIDFCSPDEFAQIVEKATIVITHAGVGSMVTALQFNKPIVVLPRKAELGEVDNNHQFDTAEQFEKDGLVLVALSEEDLKDKIAEATDFIPASKSGESKINKLVKEYIESIEIKKKQERLCRSRIWPYYILERTDKDIVEDLKDIISFFQNRYNMDSIVFIPNAGIYLADIFQKEYGGKYPINFVTVQRKSSKTKPNIIKTYIFKKRLLSNLFRHIEVLARRIKLVLRISQKMTKQQIIDFDVTGKNVLVIDDSADTGTTLSIVRKLLLDKGAKCVKTACISNHLIPDKIDIDYSVYRYALLRTKNSRDFNCK